MSGLNDLGTAPINNDLDMNNLPAEGGGFAPVMQPGPLLLELSPLSQANFTPIPEAKLNGLKGDRCQVKFDDAAPLVIKQSVGGRYDGEPLKTQLSNVERPRGKKPKDGATDTRPKVSDWDYLNAALKVATRPTTNVAYATQLLADSAARKQFRADWELSWSCNDQRDAYFALEDGSNGPIPDQNQPGKNIQGCGARYYQGDVAKVNVAPEGQPAVMEYPERITCTNPQCGATIRAFGNLRGFRPA